MRPPERKDDALEANARVDRHRLIFAVVATLAALPLLLVGDNPAKASTSDAVVEAAADPTVAAADVPAKGASIALTAPVVDPVETMPEPAADSSAVAAVDETSTTVPSPARTAPTRPIPTTTTTVPSPAQTGDESTDTGQASWYDFEAGSCAHRTLALGTTVSVTNVANGQSTTCVVRDRGPYAAGRIIDLERSVFAKLAPTNEGVITVRIEW